jgi:hypothetical protein
MRERTVKIGSAGKIFNLTGWKVGFVCAAPPLMRVLAKAHQFLTFTTPAEPAGRRRLRPRQGGRLISSPCCADLQRRPRPLTCGQRAIGFDALPAGGAPTSSTSTSPLWARPTTSPSAAASSPITASPRSR